jgi:peptidylprolyl isomerase
MVRAFPKGPLLIVLLGTSLVLAACGGSDDPEPAVSAPTPTLNPVGLVKPDVKAPRNPPTKLVIRDISEGKGSPSRTGDQLTIEYYAEDMEGKVRYSSWDRTPPPYSGFVIGARGFLPGLEEGLKDMRVGGRRELLLPPRLTEGTEPLLYVIDLLEINRNGRCWATQPLDQVVNMRRAQIRKACTSRTRIKEREGTEAPASVADRSSAAMEAGNLPTQVKLTKPDIQPPHTPPTDLVTRDLSKGVSPAARNGDELAIEYHGVDKAGKVLYSSWDNLEPAQLRMKLGVRKYSTGFEEGIRGMKVGARRELLIPSRLAEERGPLFYVIDLLELNRKGKCWSAQSLDQLAPSRKEKIHDRCESRVRVL